MKYVIQKKATTVNIFILLKVVVTLSDEFLHFNRVFQPMSLLKDNA